VSIYLARFQTSRAVPDPSDVVGVVHFSSSPEIIIPNDEKLIAQPTSRRKLYDSKGREKLESKTDLRARGVESPDSADALIGAIVLGLESQIDWKEALAFQKESNIRCSSIFSAHAVADRILSGGEVPSFWAKNNSRSLTVKPIISIVRQFPHSRPAFCF